MLKATGDYRDCPSGGPVAPKGLKGIGGVLVQGEFVNSSFVCLSCDWPIFLVSEMGSTTSQLQTVGFLWGQTEGGSIAKYIGNSVL